MQENLAAAKYEISRAVKADLAAITRIYNASVDPNPQGVGADVEVIPKRAAEGVPALVEYLIGRV